MRFYDIFVGLLKNVAYLLSKIWARNNEFKTNELLSAHHMVSQISNHEFRIPNFHEVFNQSHLFILSCSRHRTTKFPNSETPIFCLLAWSNSRARHSAIYILKSRNLFYFFLNLKEASKCVLRIIKKSKQKFSCKYWGFGIRKFGCSMTWAR